MPDQILEEGNGKTSCDEKILDLGSQPNQRVEKHVKGLSTTIQSRILLLLVWMQSSV